MYRFRLPGELIPGLAHHGRDVAPWFLLTGIQSSITSQRSAEGTDPIIAIGRSGSTVSRPWSALRALFFEARPSLKKRVDRLARCALGDKGARAVRQRRALSP